MKIEFEEKQALLGVGRGAEVGTLHLEVNSGASVHVGRIFFMVRFRPWDPTNPRFWKKTEHFFNNAEQDSETATFQAAVQCCVTATLAA